MSIPPPSLSAGFKYRKLLLYNSKSKGSFFSSSSAYVCVDVFKLYLFFMAIRMLKELLQEYLKRQQRIQSGSTWLIRTASHLSCDISERSCLTVTIGL